MPWRCVGQQSNPIAGSAGTDRRHCLSDGCVAICCLFPERNLLVQGRRIILGPSSPAHRALAGRLHGRPPSRGLPQVALQSGHLIWLIRGWGEVLCSRQGMCRRSLREDFLRPNHGCKPPDSLPCSQASRNRFRSRFTRQITSRPCRLPEILARCPARINRRIGNRRVAAWPPQLRESESPHVAVRLA